jgi:hypothetical protein
LATQVTGTELPSDASRVLETPSFVQDAERAAEALLVADGSERTAVEAEPLEVTPAPGTLHVQCSAAHNGLVLPGLSVTVDSHDSARGATDFDGRVSLAVPSGVALKLRVRAGGFTSAYQQRAVPALQAGEQRELLVQVNLLETEICYVRVLAHETRQPLPGAIAMASIRSKPVAQADADGIFAVPFKSSGTPYLMVRAPGYAFETVVLRAGCDSRADACVVLLQRTAQVVVQLRDSSAHNWESYSVRCTDLRFEPGIYGLIDASDRTGVVSGNSKNDSPFITVAMQCDALGVARLADVPTNVALRLAVYYLGKEIPLRLAPLRLAPNELRTLVVELDSGCQVRGRALDQHGQPAANLRLRLNLWVDEAKLNSPVGVWNDIVASEDGDEQGRFVFNGLTPGRWVIVPSSDPFQKEFVRDGKLYPLFERPYSNAVAATPVVFEILPGMRVLELDLSIQRGLYIVGRVLDGAGKGNAIVCGLQSDREILAYTHADGQFSLGPLEPGTFQLWTSDTLPPASFAGPIAAAAGDNEVRLELRPAATLSVQYAGQESSARLKLFVGGVPVHNLWIDARTPYKLTAPPGALRLEFTPAGSSTARVRTLEVSALEEREVILRDED